MIQILVSNLIFWGQHICRLKSNGYVYTVRQNIYFLNWVNNQIIKSNILFRILNVSMKKLSGNVPYKVQLIFGRNFPASDEDWNRYLINIIYMLFWRKIFILLSKRIYIMLPTRLLSGTWGNTKSVAVSTILFGPFDSLFFSKMFLKCPQKVLTFEETAERGEKIQHVFKHKVNGSVFSIPDTFSRTTICKLARVYKTSEFYSRINIVWFFWINMYQQYVLICILLARIWRGYGNLHINWRKFILFKRPLANLNTITNREK